MPSSSQSEPNESVDVASFSQLAANDCIEKEQFDFQTCKMENTEKFEEYIVQARTSEKIAYVDQWWERNQVFSVKID